MKIISELNVLYKIDNSVSNILQKMIDLELSGHKNSPEYSRQLIYLEMVLEEEQRIIDEYFQNLDFIDDVLAAHEGLLDANFNHYDLALNNNLSELKIRRVYLRLLDKYISMNNMNTNSSIDYMPVTNLSLQISFYCKALKNCDNPEIKYRLAYICSDMEKKLIDQSFDVSKIEVPELYMSFLASQPNYETIKMSFILEKTKMLFLRLLRDYKNLENLDEYLNYLKAILSDLNLNEITQIRDVFFDLSVKNPNSTEICSMINDVFEQFQCKKLD